MTESTPPITRAEAGTAIVTSLFLVVFALGIAVTGTLMLKANRARTETLFNVHGQANHFARAGLIEATNWLRRQPTQPVTSFAPALDASADPQILDTQNPDIGLVREFRITGNTWGRYEVWKPWPSDPDSNRAARRAHAQIEDVSLLRGRTEPGSTWHLKCFGYVFERRDGNQPFDQSPNRVVATEALECEVSRLSITLPGQAALCSARGDVVDIGSKGQVLGGADGVGIYYPQNTGTPGGSGQVTGSQSMSPSAFYDDTPTTVLGTDLDSFRTMADIVVETDADFPFPAPESSLIYVKGTNLTFSAARPLVGSGLVCATGNVVMDAGSSSMFSGVLYIDGNLTMYAPAEVKGAVIVTGNVHLSGTGDFAAISYNDAIIQRTQEMLGSYRTSRPVRRMRVPD